ncbi:MAG TPA: amino acid adenylation domain-containing protein, partial [Thermoanaerobaculia bacterium]|nr:amino acid adenylation domain-containing protein [Thermoanaerobaculia bacterium]
CRAAYLSGELPVLGRNSQEGDEPADAALAPALDLADETPRAAIERALVEAVARALRLPSECLESRRPLAGLGLDSLAAVEVCHEFERVLGVPLSITEVLDSPGIAHLADTISERSGHEPRPFPSSGEEDPGELPLSRGQQALLFVDRLAPESAPYNLAGAAWIARGLAAAALERALGCLADRHPALRTRFELGGAEPRQRVEPRLPIDFQIEPLPDGGLPARKILAAEAYRPFDLERGPLFRARVWTATGGGHLLLIALHHVIADFWSIAILLRELGELYREESAGTPAHLAAPGARLAAWLRRQEQRLGGAEGERLASFWERQLAGPPAPLDLPTDRPRPPVQSFLGAARSLQLETGLARGLRAFGRSCQATLFMTLLAGFQALLHRCSAQEQIVVGSPTAGRNDTGIAGTVGYFVNPVALTASFTGNPTFGGLLEQVRRTSLAAFEHQQFPLPLLLERLRTERDASRSALFQAMFVLQGSRQPGSEGLAAFLLGDPAARLELADLVLEPVALEEHRSPFDLTLFAAEHGDEIVTVLQYNRDLFDGVTMARLLNHFAILAESALADPAAPVRELQLLSAAERQQVVVEWGEVGDLPADGALVHQQFAAQAAAQPDRVAVLCGEEQTTYGELRRRAARLAHRLRALGVESEERVAICLDRSPEMVASILGVLEAGGAYLPLDPAYPEERLAFSLEDSRARVLLTRGDVRLATRPGLQVVDLDRLERDAAPRATGPAPPVSRESLAYVIYTSGSTGRPKGVMIEHRSAAALVDWAQRTFVPAELAGVLAATSICFDLSVFELFAPLSTGGTVILAKDALSLVDLPAAGRVTLVNSVPSVMAELVYRGGISPSVRTVCLAGEPLSRALTERVYAASNGMNQVWNLYGPTEDTTYSTSSAVPRSGQGEPTIGRAVAGSRASVLGLDLQPVPMGVVGELCLAGAGLARGYLGRPDLTAERFVPDPFAESPGERLYRTGDLVRHRTNGEIEFLGRRDTQVKVRGFRIELGEIEATLCIHPDLREAVVLPRGAGADVSLVAYVVPRTGASPETEELRSFLGAKLPAYMVPSVFVPLAELPVTRNGKLDRQALPDPVGSPAASPYVAPRSAFEATLASLWKDVLGAERIGVHDNFFVLGGHSLKASQVLSKIRSGFGVDLPMRSLFEAPTIAGLAGAIVKEYARRAGQETASSLISEVEK